MKTFNTILILIIYSLISDFRSQLSPRDVIDKYKDNKFVNTYSSFKYSHSVEHCENFEDNLNWLSENKSLYIYH